MSRGQTPDIGRNGQTPASVAEKFAPERRDALGPTARLGSVPSEGAGPGTVPERGLSLKPVALRLAFFGDSPLRGQSLAQAGPGPRPRTLAVSDGYFLDLMKAIRAFALAMETEPGGIVALMTPFGKPLTICLSGSRIDSSR
jgi:hypothetical protein